MLISECRVEMKVLWKRDGYPDKKGEIKQVHPHEVFIRWSDGRGEWYEESLSQMVIINKAEWEKREEYKFFASKREGCCACGITYDSGLCTYH